MNNLMNNRFLKVMTKVFDLFLLNLLTFILSLPIFTAGAAFTALHAVLLKMVKDEEGTITSSYMKEFKSNFKGSIVGWLIILVGVAVLLFDMWIWAASNDEYRSLFWGITLFMLCMLAALASWYFAIRAKFVETGISGIKRAFSYTLYYLPWSLLMGAYTLGVLWFMAERVYLIILIPICIISILEYPKAIIIRKCFDIIENTQNDT